MTLAAGDITASSGLAKRIFDYFAANKTACGFDTFPTAAQNMMKAQAYCIAQAVVDEIVANALATVTIPAALGGLQKSTAVGTLTNASGVNTGLTGTVT